MDHVRELNVVGRALVRELAHLEEVEGGELALGREGTGVDGQNELEGNESAVGERLALLFGCAGELNFFGQQGGVIKSLVAEEVSKRGDGLSQTCRECLLLGGIKVQLLLDLDEDGGERQSVQGPQEGKMSRLEGVDGQRHRGKQVLGRFLRENVKASPVEAGAHGEHADMDAGRQQGGLVLLVRHVAQAGFQIGSLDVHAGSDGAHDLMDFGESIAGRLESFDISLGVDLADEEHEAATAVLLKNVWLEALLGKAVQAEFITMLGQSLARDKDFVPEGTDVLESLLGLGGEGIGGDAEEFAENGVVVVD